MIEPLEARLLYSADVPTQLLAPNDSAGAAQQQLQASSFTNQTSAATATSHQVFVLDLRVADSQSLLKGLLDQQSQAQVRGEQFDLLTIDHDEDGIAKISDFLDGKTGVTSLHIVSHGEDGMMLLGRTWLDEANLRSRAGDFAKWGSALSNDGDIMLYGCRFAANESGQSAVTMLAQLTGADVAANQQGTGSPNTASTLPIDWSLDYASGAIEAASSVVQQAATSAHWQGQLNTYIVTNANSSGAGSLAQAVTDSEARAGIDTISFNIAGAGPHFINMTALIDLNDVVVLDATTQAGYSGSPLIFLNGGSAGASNGISIYSSGSTIRGLGIINYNGHGITISASNTVIEGNWIGLNTSGLGASGNTLDGISIFSGNNTRIGGITAAQRNVISANFGRGINIQGGSGATISGNYIGTNAFGGGTLGNRNDGVAVNVGGNANTTIGGTVAGAGNIIANQTLAASAGVWVTGLTTGVSILGNTMYDNGGRSIELNNSATPQNNDFFDIDGGNNLGQNYPVLSTVAVDASGTTVSGTISTTANTTLRLEFFANRSTGVDPSSHGEARVFLGATTVTTNLTGTASFNATFAKWINGGDIVSATATVDLGGGDYGNTSEMSLNSAATPASNILVVDTSSDVVDGNTTSIITLVNSRGGDGKISLREAILATNNTINGSGPDLIYFGIAIDDANYDAARGVFKITTASLLPVITDTVIIDGTTQVNNVGDTNSGLMGAGGTVGVDNLALSRVARPEIEITDGLSGAASVDYGLQIINSAANSIVRGLAIYGFKVNDIRADANNLMIEQNVLGTQADSFTSVGLALGSQQYVFSSGSANSGVLRNNLIGFAGTAGISLFGTDSWNIQNNEIRENGTLGATRDGIGIGNSTNTLFFGNLVVSSPGSAVEVYGNSISTNLTNNTFTNNNFGGGSETWAIRIDSSSSLIYRNVISNNTGAGVVISGGTANAISQNSIFGNTLLGIDLSTTYPVADGLTLNDNLDGDTGPNNYQNTPSLFSASSNGVNQITVVGSINSAANNFYRIEYFSSPTLGAFGAGEAKTYLGFKNVSTDGVGNADISIVLSGALPAGQWITTTATLSNASFTSRFDTSEISIATLVAPAGVGVTVSLISGTTTESGGSAQLSIVLDSAPTANVVINLSSSTLLEGFINVSSVTFTPLNWNVAQVVTVTGVDDTVIDGNKAYTFITSNTVSTDLNYNNLSVSDVSLTNTDNDTYNLIVVDTVSDTSDGDTSSLSALTASRGADGRISLREAITAANNTANGVGGTDKIVFNILDPLVAGRHTISIGSALPAINDSVSIDATSEPDYVNKPVVALAATTASFIGLHLNTGSSASEIKGLQITNFQLGIWISSNNNLIVSNYIGTDGVADLGNAVHGIEIAGSNNQIGLVAQGNLISGNNGNGININGVVSGNTIQANLIGVDATGTAGIGNSSSGVSINGASVSNSLVGGDSPLQGNTIAFNGANGIIITLAQNNALLGNSIFSNGLLGIDLGSDGVSANDTGDADTGANALQNFPVLTSAELSGGLLTVSGSFNSADNQTYRIEIFSSPAETADSTGYGEGKVFIGSFDLVYPLGSPTTAFNQTFAVSGLAVGNIVSATATRKLTGTTYASSSEFAQNITITAGLSGVSGSVFNDSNANGSFTGGGLSAFAGALVYLFKDNGDGVAGAADTLISSKLTSAAGFYSFDGLNFGTYFAVVDSRSLASSLNGGYAASDVWFEQTAGAAGSVKYDSGSGTYSYRVAAGDMLGGRQRDVSDQFSGTQASLPQAEHLIRLTVGAAANSNSNDFAFSSSAIVNSLDGDYDALLARSQQGTLRQFLQNSAALSGAQQSHFRLVATDPNYSVPNGYYSIAVATSLPVLTDGTLLDGASQQSWGGDTNPTIYTPAFDALRPFVPQGINSPEIELFGVAAAANGVGITQQGTGGGINNLAIYNFSTGIASSAINSFIYNNFIGTTAQGTDPVGQRLTQGIVLTSSSNITISTNLIGFTKASGITLDSTVNTLIDRNTITDTGLSFATTDGINAVSAGNSELVISRNSILKSRGMGIDLGVAASPVISLNFIDRSGLGGVEVGGIRIGSASVTAATIQSNVITRSGDAIIVLGNGAANGHQIGGIALGNTIVNNSLRGISLNNTNGVRIQGNTITNNFDSGIWYAAPSIGTLVGGVVAGEGNTIALGQGPIAAGIIADVANLTILGNSIYQNSAVGISLSTNRNIATANDLNDADLTAGTGPQNYPILTSVIAIGVNTQVMGTLNTRAGRTYRIEVFKNPAAIVESNGFSEGAQYLGFFNVASDALGMVSFNQLLSAATSAGDKVTAIATETFGAFAYGFSSEFSLGATVTNASPSVLVTPITSLVTTESGGTAQFTVVLTTQPTADVTFSVATTNATESSVSASSITFTSANWNIAQTITVTGIDDTWIDGNKAYSIILSPTVSADPLYNGINPADVALSNTDLDTFNTIVVDTTSDAADGVTTNINALMNSKGADGKVSLREAILAANNTVNGVGGADRIVFNIPDALLSGAHTISLGSALSFITDAVAIDASTEPDFSANGNKPVVVLDGNDLVTDGLTLSSGSSGSSIRGLVIRNFANAGIGVLTGSNNNIIAGNYIGELTTQGIAATAGLGNGRSGIYLQSSGNTIGGLALQDRNVLSGNGESGLAIINGANNNSVSNNFIGVDVSGNVGLGNGSVGIYIGNANGNIVGGFGAGLENVISGNTGSGVYVALGSSGTQIRGNIIGLNAAGTAVIGNGDNGITLASASSTVIGGTQLTDRNIISGNANDGINISAGASTGNSVQGNFIGTNIAGTALLGLQGNGIMLAAGANGNQIGGVAAGNVIGGNNNGIALQGIGTSNNLILGNIIGTDLSRTINLGNLQEGVEFSGSASNNVLGGVNLNEGNAIYFNGGVGWSPVAVQDGVTGIAILGNEFVSTIRRPVVLGWGNAIPLPNDIGDADTGANNYQNFPVLSSIKTNALNQVTIDGLLQSTANSFYRVEFFATPTQATSGYGDARNYLGFANLTTNASGDAVIATTLAYNLPSGYFVSATATRSNAAFNAFTDTSEFARNAVALPVGQATITVDTTSDAADGDSSSISALLANRGADGKISLREAIIAANNTANDAAGADRIAFAVPISDLGYNVGRGVFEFIVGASLPVISDTLIIDGTTQTAAIGNTNLGQLGTGGTVGVDALTLSKVERPEIEIHGQASPSSRGLSIDAASSVVRGIAIFGFQNSDILLTANATNTLLEGNIIGASASSYSDPGAASRSRTVLIDSQGANGVTIQNNLFGYSNNSGIFAGGASSGWVVVNNEMRGVGILSPSADMFYSDGANNTVRGNLFDANQSSGIEIFSNASSLVLVNNTISNSTGSEGYAVRIQVNAGVSHRVEANIIQNNSGAGVVVTGFGNVALLRNSISGNSSIGINLGSDGVTLNDLNDVDTGPNALQNFPVIVSAVSFGGNTTVTASLNSKPSSQYRIEVFASPTGDPSGYGQALTYLGYTSITTDATGNANFSIGLTGISVPVGYQLTVTATQELGAGVYAGTSEFALNVAVTGAPPGITVTPVSGLVTSETGGTAQFSVVLNTVPTADVVITLSLSDVTEGSLSVTTLTFTAANWNVAQIINITGVADGFIDANIVSTVLLSAAVSTDPAYSGIDPVDVTFTNQNSDTVNTITVDTTSDANDGDTSSVAALLANKGADGKVSLREAILAANATANGVGGADRILFNIPDALVGGAHTINVLSALPSVAEAVYIDGTSEPDSFGQPVVVLSGIAAGAASGLSLEGAGGSTIRGLVINGFSANGIQIANGSDSNTIVGNFIGIDASGSAAVGNGNAGILILSRGNVVGGFTSADRNVISGNTNFGVALFNSGSVNNTVQGNYIGTDKTGNVDVNGGAITSGNSGVGLISGANNNTIGGVAAGAGNVISGNNWFGIEASGVGSDNNAIQGNLIGLNAAGTAALANSFGGVLFYTGASNNLLGGTIPTARNFIAGNGLVGVQISGSGASNNKVQGNTIGLGIDDSAIGNGGDGVAIVALASSNTIGTDSDGFNDAAESNVIASNVNGVSLSNIGTTGNTVAGNTIGSNASRTVARGNSGQGIALLGGSSGNMIGGAAPQAGNYIANSGLAGVRLNAGDGTFNSVIGSNQFISNGGLGIDLGTAGVTLNDLGDSDIGDNDLQNFPVLTAAYPSGSNTVITGSINSVASATFRIDFYSNSLPDASGYGEASIYLGFTTVTTDASGNGIINATLSGVSITPGDNVTAIATRDVGVGLVGPTSEFAKNIVATSGPPAIILSTLSVASTSEVGTTSSFTVVLSTPPTAPVTITFAVSDSTEATLSATTFTFTSANWNVPQIIQITGLDDSIVDGTVAYSVSVVSIATSDPAYSALPMAGLTRNLTNTDDDLFNSIVVDTASDISDGDTSSINALMLSKGADGFVSLREAILATNNTPNAVTGVDRILFNIPGNPIAPSSTIPINLLSALPSITDAVYIDGTSEPGYGASKTLEINGQFAGADAVGFAILSDNSTINGIGIAQFDGIGVALYGNNNLLTNSVVISVSTSNSGALNNAGYGVVDSGNNNRIANNTISGNITGGILIRGALGSVIQGNLVGTDASGLMAFANGIQGIKVLDSSSVTIGGGGAGQGNVISGNNQNGIEVLRGTNVTISGNLIGLDAFGNYAIANGHAGIWINAGSGSVIGGASLAEGNTISGNTYSGVAINAGVAGAQILNNQIGTNKAGTLAIGNAISGVSLNGSTATVQGNVIGGSGASGVEIKGSANILWGNYIGVDRTGFIRLLNNQNGVVVQSTGQGNYISRNQIENNLGLMIDLNSDGATPNDLGDADSGANSLLNTPTLVSAITDGMGSIRLTGTYNGEANSNFSIEVYEHGTSALGGVNARSRYVGSFGISTDALGNASYSQTMAGVFASDTRFSATATKTGGFAGTPTSEYSPFITAQIPGVVVSPISVLVVTEGGATASFTVALTAAPTADVIITIAPSVGSEVSLSTTLLTFTAANWNLPQTVVVTGLQDFVSDGSQLVILNTSASVSSDPSFNALVVADVSVINQELPNQAPVITAPIAFNAIEDTPLLITGSGIMVSDTDASTNPVSVTLTVSNGVFSLGQIAGLSFSSGDGASDSTMAFTGTLAALNAALDSLLFTPNANFFGTANLSIAVDDLGNSGSGGPASTLQVIAINVAGVNDVPVFSGSSAVLLDEGSAITLNSTMLRLSDVDTAASDLVFTLTTISNGGQLRLNGTALRAGDSFSQADINAGAVAYIHFGGELPSEQITLGMGDRFGTQLAPTTINIAINAVNDAPTINGLQGGSISEITSNGAVVATVLETDPDNLTGAVFSLLDSAQGTFTIDAQTGVITVADASKVDYETAATLSIRVKVTDAQGLSSERAFAIQIADIPELVVTSETGGNTGNPVTVPPLPVIESPLKPPATETPATNRGAAQIEAPILPLSLNAEASVTTDAAFGARNSGGKKATVNGQDATANSGNALIRFIEERKGKRLELSAEMIDADGAFIKRINVNGEMIERLLRDASTAARNGLPLPIVSLSEFVLPKTAQPGVIDDDLIDSKSPKTRRYEVFIDSVELGGMVLSVGVVAWVARTGGLLAALISALPAWKGLDPLLVLSPKKQREESDLQEFTDTDFREDEEAVKAVLA